MFEYENVTAYTLEIPNVGVVEAGKTIKSNVKLENANLKLVQNQQAATPAPPAQAQPVAPSVPVQPEAPAPAAQPQPQPQGENKA